MKVETHEDSYQLSPMQQGMLFHSLYAQHSGVDIKQIICVLHENLNVSAFQRAWQRVVERHPVLRTSFCWDDKEPLQYVHPQVRIPLEQQDWCGLSALEQSERLQVYLQIDRQHGFGLTSAPLMRLALFRVSETDYQFIWTFHPALLDGRSLTIVLKEVFAFYDAFCEGEDLQLQQPPSYRDYIKWLHQQDLSKAEDFWRQLLLGFTAPTPLVVDQAHEAGEDKEESDEVEQEHRLSIASTNMLQSLAQQHQLTLNTLVQGAWALLLWRYSGEADVVFGATTCCRSSVAGAESMVGLLSNTLPVRVRVSPHKALLHWLKELRAAEIALRDYEHTPLVKIQEWSDIPSPTPLFDSVVVFENYHLNSTLGSHSGRWENLEVRLVEQTNYPLMLVGCVEPELLLKIKYDPRRFDDETIARMLGHVKTLLEGMPANLSQRLVDLPLLTERQSHQQLVEWNDTQADYPKDLCIHQLFEAQVERSPDAVAVVFEDKQLTYRELNLKANRIAHYLLSLGVGPEVLVGICMDRSFDMIVGLLGILKAGGAYVPLDPAYPQERLALMLENTQVSVLLTQARQVEKLPPNSARVICLDTEWESIANESPENLDSGVTLDNLAYVMHTSGSTSTPKAVLGLHKCPLNRLYAEIYRFSAEDICCQKTSLNFVDSIWEIFAPLSQGRPTVIITHEILIDPRRLVQTLAQHQVTRIMIVPSLLRAMLDTYSDLQNRLPKLKYWFCGGEALSLDLSQRFVTQMPQAILLNLYGLSELWDVTWYDTRKPTSLPFVPNGRPINNVQVYILDSHRQLVPVGVKGELHVGGVGLARGYLNRADLTAQKFIPNPFSNEPGARLYKTGDLARYLPDGNIEYIGRSDNQVKIHGFRMELNEIEAVMEQHPGVRETVVMVRKDVFGDKGLVAYVVPNQEQVPTNSQLRRFLKQKLPHYMIPSIFVMLDALPLTPSGKVDRRLIPNGKVHRRVIPAPNQERPALSDSLVAIQTGGSKSPLFCVHSGDGNVLVFQNLARHLGSEQPVYGLQALELDGKQFPHTRIEDMAADYIKQIRTVQPEGPYLLAGFSTGGVVAFEMAQQLNGQGQKVALLALFDTYCPVYFKPLSLRDWVSRHLSNLLRLEPKQKLTYFLKGTKQRLQKITPNFYLRSGLSLPQAVINYVPQVYSGRVILLRSSEQPWWIANDLQLGWGGLAARGLEIHEVPGDQISIIKANVGVLAEQLRACLDSAQAVRSEHEASQ